MDTQRELLVVDDDATMRGLLTEFFGEQGYCVGQAASAEEALERVREREIDVVLSDVDTVATNGVAFVGALHRIRPETLVVLMTAFGSGSSAVEALRAGAFDSITKPFACDVAALAVERALALRALEEENRRLRLAVDPARRVGDLIGAHRSRGQAAEGLTSRVIAPVAESSMSLRELDDRYTEEILRRTGGNKVHAAEILGIDRKTLYRRAERREKRAQAGSAPRPVSH